MTLLAGCGGPPEDTRPGTPVAHRQAAFKAILRTFEPMGVMLRENRYKPDDFLELATKLQTLKDGPWQYFGADTNYPPSKARDTAWSDTQGFAKARQAFLDDSAALLDAAKTRDKDTVTKAFKLAQDSCKSCHDDYRRK